MVKHYLVLLGFILIVLTSTQVAKAEDMYVTTEDIILDIVFLDVDKMVIKEYGQNTLFNWQWKGIVDITYNDNHSYDVSVKIEIPSKNLDAAKQDLVKIRISPSCDSDKINKQKCNHGFEIKILDYKHLSQ